MHEVILLSLQFSILKRWECHRSQASQFELLKKDTAKELWRRCRDKLSKWYAPLIKIKKVLLGERFAQRSSISWNALWLCSTIIFHISGARTHLSQYDVLFICYEYRRKEPPAQWQEQTKAVKYTNLQTASILCRENIYRALGPYFSSLVLSKMRLRNVEWQFRLALVFIRLFCKKM